jgi:hypothetical protein
VINVVDDVVIDDVCIEFVLIKVLIIKKFKIILASRFGVTLFFKRRDNEIGGILYSILKGGGQKRDAKI